MYNVFEMPGELSNECLKKPGQRTEDQDQYIPEFDYGHCINCLCCMEMCPEKAIYNGKSLLYKFTSLFQK